MATHNPRNLRIALMSVATEFIGFATHGKWITLPPHILRIALFHFFDQLSFVPFSPHTFNGLHCSARFGGWCAWCASYMSCARTWDCTNPIFENRLISVDVLFVDQSGDAIQATVRPPDVQWLRDSIQEGYVYLCTGFIVITSTNDYRACANPDMMFMTRRTTTFQICSEETLNKFPMNSFDIADHYMLLERAYKT